MVLNKMKILQLLFSIYYFTLSKQNTKHVTENFHVFSVSSSSDPAEQKSVEYLIQFSFTLSPATTSTSTASLRSTGLVTAAARPCPSRRKIRKPCRQRISREGTQKSGQGNVSRDF